MLRTGGLATARATVSRLWRAWRPVADEWPSFPVRIVVAFAPGGSADQLARVMATELAAVFKQQFFVENQPGDSGAIGSEQVARAEPDGYTLQIGAPGSHRPARPSIRISATTP